MLIKWISQFSGWRTNNCFAGFHLACSRLSVVWGERGKKGGDCLGSWGERKKRASEEKRGETVSVVGASEKSGRVRKKRGRLSR